MYLFVLPVEISTNQATECDTRNDAHAKMAYGISSPSRATLFLVDADFSVTGMDHSLTQLWPSYDGHRFTGDITAHLSSFGASENRKSLLDNHLMHKTITIVCHGSRQRVWRHILLFSDPNLLSNNNLIFVPFSAVRIVCKIKW